MTTARTPETVTVLRDVRPWGGEPVDLHVADGRIAAVTPHDPAAGTVPEAGVVDGRGLLALPGLVNAHAHVDKSWWGRPWVSYGGEATTQGRIAHERAHRDELGIPGVDVTLTVLREFVRHGTTAIRTHVDVDLGLGLRGIEVVREALAALDG
ncbi:MAG: cytosine deaminase, partial [Cellulosimicrobium funkei]